MALWTSLCAARQARNSACTLYVSKTAECQFGAVLELAHHMHATLETGVPVSELPVRCPDAAAKLSILCSVHRLPHVRRVLRRFTSVCRSISQPFPSTCSMSCGSECTEFVVGWFLFSTLFGLAGVRVTVVPTPEDLRAMFQRANLRASA